MKKQYLILVRVCKFFFLTAFMLIVTTSCSTSDWEDEITTKNNKVASARETSGYYENLVHQFIIKMCIIQAVDQ